MLLMELELKGRHVVVAGASRGLGFAVVHQLLVEGAKVTALGRNSDNLDLALGRWLRSHPNADVKTVPIDLSTPAAIAKLEDTVGRDGSVDGLIVVAGNGRPTGKSPSSAIADAVAQNVMPAVVSVEALAPRLCESDAGAVVLTSSIAGVEYLECPAEYAAAKTGLHAYGSHWSRSLRPVRVNVLTPGNMMTDGSVWERRVKHDPEALSDFLGSEVTLGRLGRPDEVARVAVFLVSRAASFITGTSVIVDGGQVRRW